MNDHASQDDNHVINWPAATVLDRESDKTTNTRWIKEAVKLDKVKAFPYSIPSVGSGADPGVQAVSPQVTVSYPSGGRLPLLSSKPAVTFPVAEPVPSYTAW